MRLSNCDVSWIRRSCNGRDERAPLVSFPAEIGFGGTQTEDSGISNSEAPLFVTLPMKTIVA